MVQTETKLIEYLTELKQKYSAISVKSEFEAEGASFNETKHLKSYCDRVGIDMTVKIGGCEAINDLIQLKDMEVKTIVAPMIESLYAVEKYIKATRKIFSPEQIECMNFYINIETVTGYKNAKEILNGQYGEKIDGVVMGRSDLAGSLGLKNTEVDSQEIKDMALRLSDILKNKNKDFILGGGITSSSTDFIRTIPYMTGLETRKIIFDIKHMDINILPQAIEKAINFELLWLEYLSECIGKPSVIQAERIKTLKQRLINKSYKC